jgi:poly(A) polymerase/tRNA nucleotidyltransferase (CCA-adding enzyme)
MFFSDTETITLQAVRRMIVNVGRENIWDLMDLRVCDRIGTGRPKENPYRLRKYKAMIDEALRAPTSVGMLKIDGKRVMEVCKLPAGPKIGNILHALFNAVLEDPTLNTPEYLEKRAVELAVLTDKELLSLGMEGRKKKEEKEQKEIGEIRKKHHVL